MYILEIDSGIFRAYATYYDFDSGQQISKKPIAVDSFLYAERFDTIAQAVKAAGGYPLAVHELMSDIDGQLYLRRVR